MEHLFSNDFCFSERLSNAKRGFWTSFDNEDRSLKFRGGRMHLGSYVAIGMSFYNLHYLQQRIIKQAIHFTKSKNPRVIKFTQSYLSVLYFVGLVSIWHIPSISSEIAFKLYFATASGTYNFFVNSQKNILALLSDQNIKAALSELDQVSKE